MDIFEYAMQMEKDQEEFYREIANNTEDEGLKSIMLMLADEEVKHYRTVQKMKDRKYVMSDTTILGDASKVFKKMAERGDFVEDEEDQIEVYKEAQEIEKRSELLYEEKAEEAEDEQQKKLLERLAEEERKHYFLLDNIIEFVSRPEYWLENAEWNHLEAY